jgi:hypothetical protein
MLTARHTENDGQLYIQEIQDNIKYFENALDNKIKAVKSKKYKVEKLNDVLREKKLFDVIKNRMLDPNIATDDVLTKGEKEYYDFMRNTLEDLLPEYKHATNVYVGRPFTPLHDYLPLVAIGRDKGEGGLREMQMDGLQVDQMFTNPNKTRNLQPGVSRWTRERVGSKVVFYNNNSLSVFDNYVTTVLFDIHAAKAIASTHEMLSSKAAKELLGVDNVSVLYDKNKRAVQITRMNIARFSDFTRFIEKYKGLYLTSQIGTVKQLFLQTLSMAPANVMINPKGAVKATKFIGALMTNGSIEHPNPDVKTIGDWFSVYGAGIQLRDVLMEKIGSVESYSSRRGSIAEKMENTTTWFLRYGDNFSARFQFLAAFLELGGDINNPDPDIMMKAELRTDLTQNISDPKFAANMFLASSDAQRIMHTFAYFLKSFAANVAVNSVSAANNILSTGGTRMAWAYIAQAMTGAMIFSALGAATREFYRQVASAVTGEDDERNEEEIWREVLVQMYANALGDIILPIAPTIIENLIRREANKTWKNISEGSDVESVNPFYADDSLRGASGGYAPLMDLVSDVNGMFNDIISLDFQDWDAHDALYVMSQALSFTPLFPMRGEAKRWLLNFHKSFERKKTEGAKKRAVRGGSVRTGPN